MTRWIAPIKRNPDEAPKLKWYVAAFQYLVIIALLAGLCVFFVFFFFIWPS